MVVKKAWRDSCVEVDLYSYIKTSSILEILLHTAVETIKRKRNKQN